MYPEERIANLAQDIARRGIPAKHPIGNRKPAVLLCSALEGMIAPVLSYSANRSSLHLFIQESACAYSRLRLAECSFHGRDERRINRSSGSQTASFIICKSPPDPKKTRTVPTHSAQGARSLQRMSSLADAFESLEINGKGIHRRKCSSEQRLLYRGVPSETGVNVNE